MWCGIFDNQIVGQQFCRGNLTAEGYRHFSVNEFSEVLTDNNWNTPAA